MSESLDADGSSFLVEDLIYTGTDIAYPLRSVAGAVLSEVLMEDGPSPACLLALCDSLRRRVYELYDDLNYQGNPTEEAWPFAILLHQWLSEQPAPAFLRARRRMATFLVGILESWDDKDEGERGLEMHFRSLLEEEDALLLA